MNESGSLATTQSKMSLGGRLINVVTAPGEVFEAVKTGPSSTGNWLVPVLLSCVLGVVSSFVIFSQEAILQQIREKQERALQKSTAKMPKEQREKVREMAELMSSPTLMKTLGSIGGIVRSFSWLFFMALVLWLLGTQLFKGSFSYMQAVEVCGLATIITILGGIISTLLAVVVGNPLATPGPALFVSDLNASNPVHLLLSACNVMTLWYLGVLAIGLTKLSAVSFGKAAVWLFSVWAIIAGGLIGVGWAAQRVFS